MDSDDDNVYVEEEVDVDVTGDINVIDVAAGITVDDIKLSEEIVPYYPPIPRTTKKKMKSGR